MTLNKNQIEIAFAIIKKSKVNVNEEDQVIKKMMNITELITNTILVSYIIRMETVYFGLPVRKMFRLLPWS